MAAIVLRELNIQAEGNSKIDDYHVLSLLLPLLIDHFTLRLSYMFLRWRGER